MVSRRYATISHLAAESSLDLDDVIVRLWDIGVLNISAPNDRLSDRWLDHGRRALGLEPVRNLRRIDILAAQASVDVDTARDRLQRAGVISRIDVDRIPKGQLALARRELAKVRVREPSVVPPEPAAIAKPDAAPRVASPLAWKTIGRKERVVYLGAQSVREVHEALVADFKETADPISPAGVADEHLLESAVFRAQTALADVDKYPTVAMAGAALFHSLVLNHAFYNGNKRTALVSLLVFLDENRYVLEIKEDELFRYVLRVAQHNLPNSFEPERADREVLDIAGWLSDGIRQCPVYDVRLRFGDLRRILNRYGCEIKIVPGNRARIIRSISASRWFGRARTLKCHPFYRDEGTEVKLNTMKMIRRDLWLDDDHGYDSATFYERGPQLDHFIARYRKTLKRLARL